MKKVALVYDWVDKTGGVERMLQILREFFPDAPLFTSIYDPSRTAWAKDINVQPSWMQMLPNFIKHSRLLSLPFFPYAFESMDFYEYDTVISVSSSFAKGIITRPEIKHVSIVLTPPRFLWDMTDTYIQSDVIRILTGPYLAKLRKWDYIAGQRPDILISISQHVNTRVKKTYKRNTKVIYPPFDSKYWEKMDAEKKDELSLPAEFFLVVARMEKYKKIDLVINAFNKLPQHNLVIVGTGTELETLKSNAPKNTLFLENVTDQQLAVLYTKAKALIMMQEEDFGYTALEAIFFGCPVITYKNSGAAEVVENNETGIFIEKQTQEALVEAIERFAPLTYNVSVRRKKINEQFSKEMFKMALFTELQF